ncbi:MAG TPA: thiamine pyrophosphate-dependent enzyme [Trinickia sp.]|jgi:acetolactate synthase-1/2/3 large subunit|nr:thiamine pyrophosphate-dependent enzyme [Trinickia sp.]
MKAADMSVLTVAGQLVDALVARGVDTVFVMPGDQLSPLFDAMHAQRHRIRVVVVRHEQTAAYMAYGAARATGAMGVCIVPPGPGALNALAGLSIALAAGTPVLCITGQIPLAMIGKRLGHLHELPDQLLTLRSVTKWAGRIACADDATATFNAALAAMYAGAPGPVALEVPPDVLRAPAALGGSASADADPPNALPDAHALDRAAAWLARARRPLVVAGGGAIGARAALGRLAERLQAPVVSNGGGRGVLDARHPLAMSVPAGHRLWRDADVVLGVGTRLGRPYCEWGADDAMKVIRIDSDRTRLETSFAGLGIVADAQAAVDGLEQRLADYRAPSRAAELAAVRAAVEREFAAIDPQASFVAALRGALPDDGVLVDELTQIGYACRIGYPVYAPRTYITSSYQGALGYGFATALGVKAAQRQRAVVSINGDGGFLYTANDLATAVQYRLGVIAVVFNDNAYGNVLREQAAHGYQLATSLHNPDFGAHARAFGAFAQRVDSAAALADAIRDALDRELPTVIEVPVGAMTDPWPLLRLPRVRGGGNPPKEAR